MAKLAYFVLPWEDFRTQLIISLASVMPTVGHIRLSDSIKKGWYRNTGTLLRVFKTRIPKKMTVNNALSAVYIIAIGCFV